MNHAVTGPNAVDNCMKFIEILGLRNIFPLFMKTPKKQKKGPSEMEHEGEVILYSLQVSPPVILHIILLWDMYNYSLLVYFCSFFCIHHLCHLSYC